MRREAVISALLLAVALGGCSWRKPKQPQAPAAPAPAAQNVPVQKTPPPPLSVPQTQVTLPEPQPLDPEALATAPVPQPRVETPPAARPPRRQPAAVTPQPRPEPPPQVPAAEERPPVQAVVPAEQQRQLQDQAQNWKREVRQVLQKLQRRSLNRHDRDLRDRIESVLKQSDEAEQRGDMRQAAALADRAQVLSREFQSGR